jgi:hypothetical protein
MSNDIFYESDRAFGPNLCRFRIRQFSSCGAAAQSFLRHTCEYQKDGRDTENKWIWFIGKLFLVIVCVNAYRTIAMVTFGNIYIAARNAKQFAASH